MTDVSNLYLALIHYPVQNRKGEQVGSAVTNLDLHDLARTGKTFGVKAVYIVTPYEDQIKLVKELIDHWTKGAGGRTNPDRKKALELLRVFSSWDQVLMDVSNEDGVEKPVTVATSAMPRNNNATIEKIQLSLEKAIPHVLIFGTAWGLTLDFMDSCDMCLAPIQGKGDYNHLPVRSAVAIYMDRIVNGK